MLPSDDCDDCRPAYLLRRLDSFSPSTIVFSTLPFVLTFLVVAALVTQKLLPYFLHTDLKRARITVCLPLTGIRSLARIMDGAFGSGSVLSALQRLHAPPVSRYHQSSSS